MAAVTAQNQAPGIERLYTYQEAAEVLHMTAKTVSRIFRCEKLYRPSCNTVRIPESVLKRHIEQGLSAEPDRFRRPVRRRKCPVKPCRSALKKASEQGNIPQ